VTSDPTSSDLLLRWLAHAHPLWMLISIALTAVALRTGLRLRSVRRRGGTRTSEQRAAHVRIAKVAVALVLVGFVGGPLSSLWLRGWEPFGTFHAALGLLAASLFVAAAVLGRRLESARGRPLDAHAALGTLAVLAAAVAAIAGFVLLP